MQIIKFAYKWDLSDIGHIVLLHFHLFLVGIYQLQILLMLSCSTSCYNIYVGHWLSFSTNSLYCKSSASVHMCQTLPKYLEVHPKTSNCTKYPLHVHYAPSWLPKLFLKNALGVLGVKRWCWAERKEETGWGDELCRICGFGSPPQHWVLRMVRS